MVWSAAYVAAFNAERPRGVGMNAGLWRMHNGMVQAAVVLATERATLTVLALRAIGTEALTTQCCDEAEPMVVDMLECDEVDSPRGRPDDPV